MEANRQWPWLASASVVLALGCALGACDTGTSSSSSSSAEAHRLVEAGALLLDVRTPEEFAGGHIQGAVNIPVQELERRMAEVGDRERAVVVYCRSGARSATAAAMLRDAGHRRVHDLGPMSRW